MKGRIVKLRLDPVIVTDRLTLRPPRATDADDIVAGVGDLAVSRMLVRVPYPYRRAHADDFIAHAAQSAREGRNLILAIVHGRLGRPIGIVSIEDMPGLSELGYWLARPFWGRGFATEAAGAILAYGFEALGLRLVRSAFFAENRGSRRVQHKLGFAAIGRSERHSLASRRTAANIDTVLTRRRYQAAR